MRTLALATVAIAAAATLALSGCSTRTGASTTAEAGFAEDATIGVALPSKTSENFVLAGGLFTDGLKKAGFTGDVQYAGGTSLVADQQSQIQSMITKGAKVIIIGSVDGGQLTAQTKAAHDAGAVVIAYDRLIINSKYVDYYVAYDNQKVGELQGQSLLDGLAKRFPGVKPWNIELFSGSPDDANSKVFWRGAMKILQPKIDDGTLRVVSGQTDIKATATQGWSGQNAQNRMDTLLAANYSSTELHGVLSPNDTLARGIITSVRSTGKPIPVVTGQDSEAQSVKSIMAGEQFSTINKDTRKLVDQAIAMVKDLQQGKKPEINDDTSYDNGARIVPAYLLTPLIVTRQNAAEAYANDPLLAPLTK